jgi:hypothetical protein
MAERTTVRLPADLVHRAKQKALAEGVSLTALIERGLRRVVDERKTSPAGRISLPVSTRSGGVLPGVDLNNSAALQQMDDLERLGRSK